MAKKVMVSGCFDLLHSGHIAFFQQAAAYGDLFVAREPYPGLADRSSTDLRRRPAMPYRIDLAGGWLDQPWVSTFHPGPVLTISLEPTVEFNERSGMASSTRRTAIDLWGPRLPAGDPEKLAYILFCCDNPPGKTEISGSQDAIGIVFPGLNRAYYQGGYWPTSIECVHDEAVLRFIEDALYLVPLGPRETDFAVLSDTHINHDGAEALADAAEACWSAMLARDLNGFGSAVRASFEAQIAMFPNMIVPSVTKLVSRYQDRALGWKVSGAGGGGYLTLVAAQPIPNALRILIRRRDGG